MTTSLEEVRSEEVRSTGSVARGQPDQLANPALFLPEPAAPAEPAATVDVPAAGESRQPRGRRLAGLIVRPLVSAALLWVLFSKFGVGQVWQTLWGADAEWVLSGAGLVVVALAVSAWKWQLLLAAQGVTLPFRQLFIAYLVGLFFNNFLPSNIGGDVVRVHEVARLSGRRAAAAASVIGERLLAGLALALTAATALLFSFASSDTAQGSSQVALSVALVLGIFSGLVALVASPRARAWMTHVLPGGRWKLLTRVTEHIGDAFANRVVLTQVMALSLAFHAAVVLLGWVTFAAVGAPVSLALCFLFIPIISAIQLVPFSLNGLGVREGAYVFFFGGAGLAASQAVAASLLFGLLVSVISLAGGVLFAARR